MLIPDESICIFAPPVSADHSEQRICFDVVADRRFKGNFSCARSGDVVVHLHCFEHEDGLVFFHGIALIDEKLFDESGERRKHLFAGNGSRGSGRSSLRRRSGCGSGNGIDDRLIGTDLFHADFVIFTIDSDNEFTHFCFLLIIS